VSENSYGIAKRLEFIAGVIAARRPARVLDIGCGTGANLTAPLARRFTGVDFVGVDSDAGSIEFANREHGAVNVRFVIEQDAGDIGTFDLIVASEVIEHVEDPDAFLSFLRGCLAPDGQLVLTLPNGWGPFEFASLFETLLHLTGIHAVLRALKHRLRGRPAGAPAADTLAISPHINFFAYRQISALIANSGFVVRDYRPRTWLCGFGFDQLIRSPKLVTLNSELVDRLPPQMASAWMFVLAPGGAVGTPLYHRGAYARFRRYLNEKRWHIR